MNHAALKLELETDPASRGYARPLSIGADADLATLLNERQPERLVAVPTTQRALLKQLAVRGKDRAIWEAADAGNGAAWSTRNILSHPAFGGERGIDVFDPASQAMLAKLVETGVLTVTDRAALESLGLRAGSRAEELWGAGAAVTPDDVARALRG